MSMVEGIAFHWYSGDHFEAVDLTKKCYPDKILMSSECCALHEPGKAGITGLFGDPKLPETVETEDAFAYAHDLIGNLNAGMNRWIDWNLIVDKNGGPRHVPSGFAAPMIANEDGTYRKNLTFDFIAHFSRYILPGAKRIGFSKCDAEIEMTAAQNVDGSIVAVILNKTRTDCQYAIRLEGNVIRIRIPAYTLSTIVIEPQQEEKKK